MGDNLTYNNLVQSIEDGSIKSLYLLYGEETYLIGDIISRMEKKLVSPELRSINYIRLDGSSLNMEALINACETLPFMDSRKMVVVQDCGFFKGKKSDKDGEGNERNTEDLSKLLGNIPDTTVLLLVAPEQVDKRRKLYGAIKKCGDIVELKQLKGGELMRWVLDKIKQYGKTIAPGDAQYLVSRLNGDLEGVSNEINKLVSYNGDKKNITVQDIDAVVPKSLEANVFELVDMICGKNTGAALRIFNELILEGEPVAVILFMIARQYRLLLNTRLLNEKGYTNQEMASKLGVPPFVLSKLSGLSKSYTEKQLVDRLMRCVDIDGAIKKGRMDPRIAVESLIVEFAR